MTACEFGLIFEREPDGGRVEEEDPSGRGV